MVKQRLIRERMKMIVCASLLTTSPFYAMGAAKPLSESDMGDVSAESGDILNVMGATASGENSVELSETSSTTYDNVAYVESDQAIESKVDYTLKPANNDVAYIEADQPIERQVDSNLIPQAYDAEEMVSTFKISERSDGQLGASTIYVDEKEHNVNSAKNGDGTLTITQDIFVQQVQIHQPRHSATSISAGDRSLSGIHVTGSATIRGR